MKIKNNPVPLDAEQEEMLIAWAGKLETPYVQDEVFQRNFVASLRRRWPDTFRDVELADIDFSDLKKAADDVVKYFDHRNINELPPFDEELNPSAENLARYFLEYLNTRVVDDRVKVYKVRCFETPTSVATYQID